MNEFTKEELFYLSEGLSIISQRCDMSLEIKAKLNSLFDKLHLMIDNYCEHDPRDTFGPIGMYHCPECGEMQLTGMKHMKVSSES